MGRQVVPTPERVALVLANMIADQESKSDSQKGVHLLVFLLRVGSPVGSVLCLLTVSLHMLLALSCELLTPATHEDMGMAPRMWRWGTQVTSSVSVLIVNIVLTPSQRPLRASLTSSVSILMGRYW